ncbi:MAG: hypothetical protein KDB27_28555 [Planctomycetales bacterium]|nr:hypothetical protein [Planctomycetales bacterium]
MSRRRKKKTRPEDAIEFDSDDLSAADDSADADVDGPADRSEQPAESPKQRKFAKRSPSLAGLVTRSLSAVRPAMPKRKANEKKPRTLQRWKLLTVLTGLAAVSLWFAPNVAVQFGLLSYVVDAVSADFDGEVEVASASLGWISPVRLHEIVVRDHQGQVIATVDEVTTERTLIALATNFSDLGRITIKKPMATVALNASSSNWEQALAAYLSSDESEPVSTGGQGSIHLEIVDGNVAITDVETQQSVSFNEIQLSATVESTGKTSISFESQCTQADDSGRAKASLVLQAPSDEEQPSSVSQGELHCELTGFPIHFVRPLLHRFAPSIQDVKGISDGAITFAWDNTTQRPALSLDSTLAVSHFSVFADSLGDDELTLDQINFRGDVSAKDGVLSVSSCQVTAPVGHVSIAGETRLESFDKIDLTQLMLDSIEFGRTEISGKIDIAQLAQLLPNTMQIRDDTQIESGQIVWQTQSSTTESGPHFEGTLQSHDIVANQRGRLIRLQEPVHCQFDVRRTESGFEVERLVGKSSFMSFEGSGRKLDGHVSTKVALANLQNELEQIIDFGDQRLVGQLTANAKWQRIDENHVNVSSRVDAADFSWHRPNKPVWTEKQLAINAQAKLELQGLNVVKIVSGQADIVAGREKLVVALTRPVGLFETRTYPVHIELLGDLRSWHVRSQPFVDTTFVQLAGFVDANADVQVSTNSIVVEASKTLATDLVVQLDGRRYAERKAVLTLEGDVDLSKRAASFPTATLASTSISARAADIAVDWTESIAASGKVSFRGKLDRISRLAGFESQGIAASGDVQGNITASHQNGTVRFTASIAADNPKYLAFQRTVRRGQPNRNQNGNWERVWQEPHLNVSASGDYDAAGQAISFDTIDIAAGTGRIIASGEIKRLDADWLADLRGTTEYDWSALSQRFQKHLGTQVRLVGKEKKPFSIRGPLLAQLMSDPQSVTKHVSKSGVSKPNSLVPPALVADAQVGWAKAHAYGLDIDQANIEANLQNQQVRFSAFELPLAQGKLAASPLIDLRDRDRPILHQSQARVLDRVQLSPELCRTWLKYVAPLLADTTQAEGVFSVDLNRATVPLYSPQQASVFGTLEVERATVGPGSLSRQFLNLANQIKAIVDGGNASRIVNADRLTIAMRPQKIQFEMREGAVGHQGLTMHFGDVEVTTQGWVTLDEQLRMTAAIPIQRDWVEGERMLQSLAGQTLDIPIHGTLRQPRLDSRAVQKLTEKAVRGAAESIIRDELGKQLQKLFK